MNRRVVLPILAIALVAGAVLLFSGGRHLYTVELHMSDAAGLRNGSPVVVGGVPIGTAKVDADSRQVVAKLEIADQYAPLSKNATAAIISQNILGQKQVSVTGANADADAAPDGFVIPADHVQVATDLDQLLGTLDPDTRARLAILLNETGSAVAGRKMDFQRFITDFAPAVQNGDALLHQLSQDNHTLDDLIVESDSWIGELTASKQAVGDALDEIGKTTETVAARRTELREALRTAPGALQQARGLLSELEQTAQPLDQTALLVARAAPPLAGTLAKLGPVDTAAEPVLGHVPYLAKAVNALDDDTTNTLERTIKIVKDLVPITQRELPPVTGTLDRSADNIVAVLANWAHAIQFRDNLGHVFRGAVALSPQFYDGLLKSVGSPLAPTPSQATKRRQKPGPGAAAPAPAATTAPGVLDTPVDDVKGILNQVLQQTAATGESVQQLLDQTGLSKLGGKAPQSGPPANTQNLLDALLKP